MLARQLHVLLLQIPTAQSRDIARPKLVELFQQILEPPLRFQLCKTVEWIEPAVALLLENYASARNPVRPLTMDAVSYTHLRAHETRHDLVCRLLLEKKK